MAQMRQIHMGTIMYTNDEDGVLPLRARHGWQEAYDVATDWGGSQAVVRTDYVGTIDAWLCPTGASRNESWVGWRGWDSEHFANSHVTTYWALGYSSKFGIGWWNPCSCYPSVHYYFRISKLPGDQVLVQDATMGGEYCNSGWAQYYVGNHMEASPRTGGYELRSAGANAVRVGGHAQWNDLPDEGDPSQSGPGGWRCIGMASAGGGWPNYSGGMKSLWGYAMMVPGGSAILDWGDHTVRGTNIFFGAGSFPKPALIGFYDNMPP